MAIMIPGVCLSSKTKQETLWKHGTGRQIVRVRLDPAGFHRLLVSLAVPDATGSILRSFAIVSELATCCQHDEGHCRSQPGHLHWPGRVFRSCAQGVTAGLA